MCGNSRTQNEMKIHSHLAERMERSHRLTRINPARRSRNQRGERVPCDFQTFVFCALNFRMKAYPSLAPPNPLPWLPMPCIPHQPWHGGGEKGEGGQGRVMRGEREPKDKQKSRQGVVGVVKRWCENQTFSQYQRRPLHIYNPTRGCCQRYSFWL